MRLPSWIWIVVVLLEGCALAGLIYLVVWFAGRFVVLP